MDRVQTIAHNIARVHERIAAAAQRAGRSPDEITLIAVTKTHTPRVIGMALAAGLHDCGENRVQEADEKAPLLPPTVRWHLIGHLQRNKAKRAAALFAMIHSIDSLRLAQTLDRHVGEQSLVGRRRLPVLLQINVSGEETKEGFAVIGGVENRAAVQSLVADAEQIAALPNLHLQGLMTIAPYSAHPDAARPTFRSLRLLRDELARRVPHTTWQHLSMGMTGDFEPAIEEGATLVRIGRAIFGDRT